MRSASLGIKILFWTAGFIAVLGLIMTLFVRSALQKALYEKLQKRGISIAKNIAQASVNPMLTEQFVELELTIRDYQRSEDDIEYIFLLNASGQVRAHTFRNGFPVELNRVNRAGTMRQFSVQRVETEHGAIIDIAVPLLNGSAGVAHVGLSEDPVRKSVDDIVRTIIWIIMVVLGAGIVISIALARKITGPVRELAAAALAVGRGDLQVRLPVRSNDEIGLLGTAFNEMIQARKAAEDRQKQSEKKVRDITASLGEGVLVVDTVGRMTSMNPEAEQLLGWSERDLAGKPLHDIIHGRKKDGSPLPAHECPSMRVLLTGEREKVDDDIFIRRDGTVFPVSFISAPIRESGAVIAVVIAFQDITRLKQNAADREQLLLAYEDALANIKTLKGMMPICSSCKKIRDDKGYWNHIETYIQSRSEAEFSHGICPECAKKLYPEYYRETP